MKIEQKYPPNFQEINAIFPYKDGYVYAYGDTIFNPSGREVPLDIQFHEKIHSLQQGNDPSLWWKRYLKDTEFRESQEIEAYAGQYQLIKKHHSPEVYQPALDEFASVFGKMYNIFTPIEKLKTRIRKFEFKRDEMSSM